VLKGGVEVPVFNENSTCIFKIIEGIVSSIKNKQNRNSSRLFFIPVEKQISV
jgi:hypothetical protein